MNDLPHTSDNIHLSEPQKLALMPQNPSAVSCNSKSAERLERLISASLSENTKRAYVADLAHFVGAGGQLPATSEMVALYLSRFAEQLAVLHCQLSQIRSHARTVSSGTQSDQANRLG